ncbi:MAG: hypothetical protein H6745_15810 [Deltaproteobacteria bacterium]|nr:hypothetical protein [Deltaproteobacteria bacterium]
MARNLLKMIPVAAALLIGGACGDSGGHSGAPVCDPSPDGGRVQLVAHEDWEVAPLEADPFAEFAPAVTQECPVDARLLEDFSGTLSYSVRTLDCGYTTVEQPSLVDTCAGDTLYVWIWHFALTAPENATAHLAVQIGDDRVWEKAIPIPSDSGLFTDRVPLTKDYPAGTPVYFHVRNHGSNSYNLLELSLER